uniref:histone deacetylase n=2 Tax=Amphora coffeiformis TaxID=265554 RepID=A0A7S3LBJ3_9STRA
MKSTPAEARRILGAADPSSLLELEQAIRRTSYDPVVLKQDGWSTQKSNEPEGATGGANWIGDMVRVQNSDAVVLAFVYDPEIGDLWKVAWIEHGELTTFDLEAEELQEARKKWIRRQTGGAKTPQGSISRKSSRFFSSEKFAVPGVEEGIVLAASLSKNARQGVYWPARVMHPSENSGNFVQSKRSSSKQKLDLVFLAPYWDSENTHSRSRTVEGLSESGPSAFHNCALFQVELVEATFEMIQPYPFDPDGDIDIDQVRNSFRFTGLPKAAFSRFLNSHRLALSLKAYARKHAKRSDSPANIATAGLFETHPLAVRAPIYPSVVLHLPFSFILSQLPPAASYKNAMNPSESILQLSAIVNAMKPPNSWGATESNAIGTPDRPITTMTIANLTPSIKLFNVDSSSDVDVDMVLQAILSGLPNLQQVLSKKEIQPGSNALMHNVSGYLLALDRVPSGTGGERKCKDAEILAKRWACMRALGEDTLALDGGTNSKAVLQEWRIAAERMYRHFATFCCREDKTLVITDFRCNGHMTNGAAFERNVRLPATLKGARLAGLGKSDNLRLLKGVTDECLEYVESSLLSRAHGTNYLEKIKSRCSATQSNEEVIMLTEDSDGNGGEDTRGSRGTWTAAVCGVAAAVTAVEKVVAGEFVNAFCATRPPGHHAGRSFHPMNAVSNGFCVLNPAACAAIHATTPIADGGRGLRRVCVIDFDVHHGNGTQDILCSTNDPRYLYISIHAGGAQVNGISPDDDMNGLFPHANKSGGIYPGRCGDVSPHPNVLNLPLGQRVTPHAVGSALINRITPAVEAFSPNLIILSAGFDAHKHDPMGLGLLSAQDFGHITDVCTQLAFKCCSGRFRFNVQYPLLSPTEAYNAG